MQNIEEYKIGLNLDNPFDYNKYKSISKKPIPIGSYLQKMGLIVGGMATYPELDMKQAYMKVISEMNELYAKKTNTTMPEPGCCGGGNRDGGKGR